MGSGHVEARREAQGPARAQPGISREKPVGEACLGGTALVAGPTDRRRTVPLLRGQRPESGTTRPRSSALMGPGRAHLALGRSSYIRHRLRLRLWLWLWDGGCIFAFGGRIVWCMKRITACTSMHSTRPARPQTGSQRASEGERGRERPRGGVSHNKPCSLRSRPQHRPRLSFS